MRCPRCNQEINPHSERCPNCGTSAKLAVPDGDTMTRVRRQISVMRRETEVSDVDLSDASFSPVLKFDKPEEHPPEEVIENNPANQFPDESFDPVDISGMIEKPEVHDSEKKHREISASIRRMINDKQDDLLAEYYFKDGISDLERYRLAQSYARLDEQNPPLPAADDSDGRQAQDEESGRSGQDRRKTDSLRRKESGQTRPDKADTPEHEDGEEMSEAAKRLSQFPEEKGFDKFVTTVWEKYDHAVLKVRKFLRRHILDRLKRLYDWFDAKTRRFMNPLLDRFYYSRFGSLKRKRAENDSESYLLRRRVWGVIGVVLVLLIGGLFMVRMMMSDEINGEWIISTDAGGNPNIIMEFKPGGSAVISVKSEDGWHVHKQGRYSTQRKNGHDLLTITYEDGDVKRLYYIIEGDQGTFINVDTNIRVVYQLK